MSKILVTGGLGFVGSNLVDKLIELENEVDVIDDLSSSSSSSEYRNDKAKYFIENINNISILNGIKYDKIFHLAAEARIQPSFENPVKWFESNSLGTMKVMEFARENNCGILVYATTSSKNHGSNYITPYTFSKVVGEGILKLYSFCYGLNCAMATFYNVYGKREPEIGEFATVVAKFIRQRRKNVPLTVVGDGSQSRDFTHVDDICDGLIKISEGNWKADNFDLGKGEPITILDLAKMILEEDTTKIQHLPLRKNEGEHTLSDFEETFKKLNWKARIRLKDYIENILNNQR